MSANVLNLKRKREEDSVECKAIDRLKAEEDNDQQDEPDVRRLRREDSPSNRNDFLKMALEKINQLYEELAEDESSDDEEDEANSSTADQSDLDQSLLQAEALGYAICAQETISFLRKEGFDDQDPLILTLRDRLMNRMDK